MNSAEAIRIALQSLWANKLRSVLTLLGVVIGVASVITVVTLVNGANTYVSTKLFTYGADVFTVSKQPHIVFDDDEWIRNQKRKNIKLEDFEAVQQQCSPCTATGATPVNPIGKVVYGTQSTTDTLVRGWTSSM